MKTDEFAWTTWEIQKLCEEIFQNNSRNKIPDTGLKFMLQTYVQ
jgi:hypothetical protein